MKPLHLTFSLMLFAFGSITSSRVLLSLYALSLGAQADTVGLLAATYYIFPLMLSWLLGRFSDRFGSRWLLLTGTVTGSCAMLVPFFVHTLPALFVAGVFAGFSFAFYNGLLQNLVGLLSKPHERVRNFSNSSLLGAITNFIGPMIAGFAIDSSGYAIACLYVVGLSMTALIMLLIWGGALPGGRRRVVATDGTQRKLADSAMIRIVATSCMVQIGQDLFQFYMPIYGHGIGLSASVIGMVLASYAVASFAVRFALPWLLAQLRERKVLAYSFYLSAGAFGLLPVFQNPWMLSAISFVFGLGMGCGQPVTTMMLFSHSAEGRSGETFGLRLTVNNFVRVVAPTAFGFIASAFGLFTVFYINAAMMASGGAFLKVKSAVSGKVD